MITSVTIGGKDVIYVKQHQSSPLSTMEIKNYIQDIGNQRFSDTETNTSSGQMKFKDKASSTLFHSLFVLFCFVVSICFFFSNLKFKFSFQNFRVLIPVYSTVRGYTLNPLLHHILLGKKYVTSSDHLYVVSSLHLMI